MISYAWSATHTAATSAGGADRAGGELGAPRPGADGDRGLADRDDHDQPVALDEVRRLQAPPARPPGEGPEQAGGERGPPGDRREPAVDEPGDDDQSRAG